MSKSFKKVVACILAVLMVMFSVPFSALAATGTDAPDISLRFGTLHATATKLQSWVDQDVDNTTAAQVPKQSGIFDVPVYLENGKLVIKSADMQAVYTNNAARKFKNGTNFAASDYTYQVGDVFTVTVMIKNVPTMYMLEEYISYSDNIEPVGVATYTDADWEDSGAYLTAEEFADIANAVDDYGEDAADEAWAMTPGFPIEAQSISGLGDGNGNKYMNVAEGKADDPSVAANGVMSVICTPLFPEGVNDTSVKVDTYTGNIMGDDMVIGKKGAEKTITGCYLETFAFKIVGTGDITFEQANPTDINSGYFTGDDTDGQDPSNYTTYAINKYQSDTEHPGSAKMTFMGTNSNVAPSECTHANKTKTNEVPATCTEAGTEAYWTCTDCNKMFSDEACTNEISAAVVIPAKGHDYEGVVTNPTCTEQGYTTYTCKNGCGSNYVGDYTDPTGHSLTKTNEVPATCETAGTEAYWTCGTCHKMFSDENGTTEITQAVAIPAKGHAYVINSINWNTLNTETRAVTANYVCDNDGNHTKNETVTATANVIQQQTETLPEITRFSYSEGDFSSYEDVETKAPAGHTHNLTKTDEVPATCTEAGTEAYWTCSGCGKMYSDADAQNEIQAPVEIPANGHEWGDWAVTTEATASTKGVETRYCSNCDATETRDIDALGVNITVKKYDIGEIEFNDEYVDGTADRTNNVAFGSTYTVEVAKGKDNFKGWEIDGMIVSKDTTYTATAYANLTITPVFEVPNANKITVVFYDKFGNKVKEYPDMDVDAYQDAINADGIPEGQSYPSQKFVSWDIADADILALTESRTIWAVYEKVESVKKFTVTVKDAAGADITATALDAAGFENGSIPYDTKVTVYNENAKGWAIDGAVVSTSDTYSFYVGADVELTMLVDVEEVPTTTIVGGNLLANPAYRWNIVATRNVAGGYELLDYGFVYGKNMSQDDLTVDNEGNNGSAADAGVVKVVRAGKADSTNQFALNYGIKAMNATVCARSFIIVKKGTNVEVIYSDMATFNY